MKRIQFVECANELCHVFFFLNHCSPCSFLLIYLFIYSWLCWVFVSVRGLSLVAASGGHSSPRCAGLSLSRPLLLRSTGSRRAGSAAVAHGPSCSAACGIFPDQGSNPCPLHRQADSQPLHHQGNPLPCLDQRETGSERQGALVAHDQHQTALYGLITVRARVAETLWCWTTSEEEISIDSKEGRWSGVEWEFPAAAILKDTEPSPLQSQDSIA